MKKSFWGFLLIFLDFNLNLNQHSLNILPDFAGCLLLLWGTKELEGESTFFRNSRLFAAGMAVYTAILWVGALLGVTSGGGWLISILNLIAAVVSLYVAWMLIQGVLDMEIRRAVDLKGRTLYQWWKGLAAVEVLSCLLSLMVNLANLTILFVLATVLIVVGFAVVVLYLVAWWKSTTAWEGLPASRKDDTETK